MPFTRDEIIKMINLDEPDYASIVIKFTEADIPVLVELTKDSNPAIATKAISCLGLMKSEKALDGLSEAINHPDPVRRIAAAHSLKHMTKLQRSAPLLEKLLDDKDMGVRKFALKTIESGNVSSLKEKVRLISQKEVNPELKTFGENIFNKLR